MLRLAAEVGDSRATYTLERLGWQAEESAFMIFFSLCSPSYSAPCWMKSEAVRLQKTAPGQASLASGGVVGLGSAKSLLA